MEAENVFRRDLEINPENGRSLFGLAEALAGQGKTVNAEDARKRFEAAWKNAEFQLSITSM